MNLFIALCSAQRTPKPMREQKSERQNRKIVGGNQKRLMRAGSINPKNITKSTLGLQIRLITLSAYCYKYLKLAAVSKRANFL
jgi:hypothetical protein